MHLTRRSPWRIPLYIILRYYFVISPKNKHARTSYTKKISFFFRLLPNDLKFRLRIQIMVRFSRWSYKICHQTALRPFPGWISPGVNTAQIISREIFSHLHKLHRIQWQFFPFTDKPESELHKWTRRGLKFNMVIRNKIVTGTGILIPCPYTRRNVATTMFFAIRRRFKIKASLSHYLNVVI